MPRTLSLFSLLVVSAALLAGLRALNTARGQETTFLRQVKFVEHRIARNITAPYELSIADLDGDGRADLLCGQHLARNSFLWFGNLKKERFEARYVDRDSPERFARHWLGDVDGDGRPDIVAFGNTGGAIVWLRNPGEKTESWPRYWIATETPRAYDGLLADVDGDGDPDFVAWSHHPDHHLVWYENRGTPTAAIWTRHLVLENLPESAAYQAIDLDRDGDLDLLAAAANSGHVFWLENPGTPVSQPWRMHEVMRLPSPGLGQAIDMDRDGDLDILLAAGMLARATDRDSHQVIWLENKGDPRAKTWPKHVISQRMTGAVQAVAADLDLDGDIDVIAASGEDPGQITWYEQRKLTSTYWLSHVVKIGWRNVRTMRLADLDGDKRPDLIAVAGPGSEELRWWKNESVLVPVVPDEE